MGPISTQTTQSTRRPDACYDIEVHHFVSEAPQFGSLTSLPITDLEKNSKTSTG